MKNFTRTHSYYLLIYLTFVISLSIFLYVKQFVHPFKFNLVKSWHIPENLNKYYHFYYKDFDHDGQPEIVNYSIESAVGFSLIWVANWNDETIDQFNFNGSFPTLFKPIILDVNRDKVDDIVMFDIVRDSLYLNVIDVFKRRFLLKRKFILNKPDSVKTDFWHLYMLDGNLLDINSDGSDELIFTVVSGYSHYPRGLYAFDFKSEKVTKKNEFGFGVSGVLLHDINGDESKEILISNNAPDNLKYRSGYHDKSVWNYILDKNFNLVSRGEEFGSFTSSFEYKSIDSNVYAFFSWIAQGKDYLGKVFKVNKDFTLTEVLSTNFHWHHTVKSNSKTNHIFYNRYADSIKLFDENFKEIRSIGFNDRRYKHVNLSSDIDNDGKEEFCVFINEKVSIYNQNFELLGEHVLEDGNSFTMWLDQLIKVKDKTYFMARTQKAKLIFEIVPNPYYSYFYLLSAIGALLIFVFLFLNYKLLHFFLVYLHYFLHSFHKTNSGLLILDSLGKILYANKQLFNFLRMPTEKYRGKIATELLKDKSEIYECIIVSQMQNIPSSNGFYYSTHEYQFNGSVTVTPFLLFSKIVLGYLVEIENLTDAVMMERNKIWSKSIQRIAHDIKTPLSSVNIGIQTIWDELEKTNSLEPQIRDDFERVVNQLTKIRSLTKSFLQFINMELINFQIVNANKSIDETLEKFHHYFKKNEVTIIKEYSSDNIYLWCDPFQLGQVFQILLENGIDAVSGYGEIRIKTEIIPASSIVKISFTDNGSGIKLDIQEKLFSPYLTTKKDGTGIGLFMAKKIVEDHKGKIYFTSTPDIGTTFTLEFPMLKKESTI